MPSGCFCAVVFLVVVVVGVLVEAGDFFGKFFHFSKSFFVKCLTILLSSSIH